MKVKIVYSEKDAAKPLSEGRAQNYLVVCDAETGRIYKATDFVVDAAQVPLGTPLFAPAADMLFRPQDGGKIVGMAAFKKMVFFEDYKGPTMDLIEQMTKAELSSAEREHVLFAKDSYDCGAEKALETSVPMLKLEHN